MKLKAVIAPGAPYFKTKAGDEFDCTDDGVAFRLIRSGAAVEVKQLVAPRPEPVTLRDPAEGLEPVESEVQAEEPEAAVEEPVEKPKRRGRPRKNKE